MRDLQTFQEKIEAYRKNAPTPHTQKELAESIPLDKDEFSKRLNAYKHPNRNTSPLTCAQVQAIVRVLARWGAIETQEQAQDLLDLMECPGPSASDWKAHPLNLLRSVPASPIFTLRKSASPDTQRKEERLVKLRMMQIDHTGFLRARLASFVGRQNELTEIRSFISKMLPNGGYITITGQAGQGKSSIIAKLVDEYGPERVPHHFIPYNPGPDYQVSLLRDVMARLILKHGLSDLYVDSESRPALRDYFPRILAEVATRGEQEVIFIDGLDQLKEDADGERDLSFLPNDPPEGVVFVLGARPNDTLQPLELRKPHYKYDLPNLSRQDFSLILDHRGAGLDTPLVDQFYQAMQGNALYLDLAAKELVYEERIEPEEIIKRVADNPENLFSLSIVRLKRRLNEWREALKPILGLLLVALEPLALGHIRQILGVDDDRLRDALARLGGLVTDDGRQRYSLFHLKLYEYLRQDENRPHKEFVFARDEEERWHRVLADWCCQGDLSVMWKDVQRDATEQGRRMYARKHYVSHLYNAGVHEWQRLFAVLDEGYYGRAKVQYDRSARMYIQDLDMGRRAAAWENWTLDEGVEQLPRLWRYALLRCSLVSQADKYPLVAFRVLVLLQQEQKALDIAELLTDPARRVDALIEVVKQVGAQEGSEQRCMQVLLRACGIAFTLQENQTRVETLCKLLKPLAETQLWTQVEVVGREAEQSLHKIKDAQTRAQMLSKLLEELVEVKQWEQAESLIHTMETYSETIKALGKLGEALERSQQRQRADKVWDEAEEQILTLEKQLEKKFPLTKGGFNSLKPQVLSELAAALAQAHRWERAEKLIEAIRGAIGGWNLAAKAVALSELGTALAQVQQLQRAQEMWTEAEQIIRALDSYEHGIAKASALSRLAEALVRAQEWERAEKVIRTLPFAGFASNGTERAVIALIELGLALAGEQRWEQAERVWAEAEMQISGLENYTKALSLTKLGRALAWTRQLNWAERVLTEARKLIQTIERGDQRVEALSVLSETLALTNQRGQAEGVWIEAETQIRLLQSGFTKVHELGKLGEMLSKARQWDRARAVWAEIELIIESSEDDSQKKAALYNFGEALIRARDWSRAEKAIRRYQEDGGGVLLLTNLVRALVRVQEWEQAEAIMDTIEESKEKRDVLKEIIEALMRAEQWERAEEQIRMIKDAYTRKEWLGKLNKALIKAQEWERAEAVIPKIEGNQNVLAMCDLGKALAEAQEWQRAQLVLANVDAFVHALKDIWVGKGALDTMGVNLVEALSKLGEALAKARLEERAQVIWAETESVIGMIQRSDTRDQALGKLAEALGGAQEWERIEKVVGMLKGRTLMERGLVTKKRDLEQEALGQLVKDLVQAQEWERAEAVIHTLKWGKSDALSELGVGLVKAQEWERAKAIIYTIIETYGERVKQAGSEYAGSPYGAFMSVWHELVRSLTQGRQWEQAENVIHIIEEESSWRIYSKALRLENLVQALVTAGEYEKLLRLVQRSWLQAGTREYIIELLPLVADLIQFSPEIDKVFYESFTWVDNFLKG